MKESTKQFCMMILFVLAIYVLIAPITSYWLVTEAYAYLEIAVPEWLTYLTNLIK